MDDKFICYTHFSLMDAKCLACRDLKQCQLDTFIRKEKQYEKNDTTKPLEDGRSGKDRL